MSAFRLTGLARADVETLVRRLAATGPRAARRALDELFASMDWLAGSPDGAREVSVPGAPDGVMVWPLRGVWLVWQAAPEAAPGEAILLRVLRRDAPSA